MKNFTGRAHGFSCNLQGTLFFDIARILKHHRPAAFLLENVPNLLQHDKGRTFEIIMRVLEQDLGYYVTTQIINAFPWVPQNRKRCSCVDSLGLLRSIGSTSRLPCSLQSYETFWSRLYL